MGNRDPEVVEEVRLSLRTGDGWIVSEISGPDWQLPAYLRAMSAIIQTGVDGKSLKLEVSRCGRWRCS